MTSFYFFAALFLPTSEKPRHPTRDFRFGNGQLYRWMCRSALHPSGVAFPVASCTLPALCGDLPSHCLWHSRRQALPCRHISQATLMPPIAALRRFCPHHHAPFATPGTPRVRHRRSTDVTLSLFAYGEIR